MHEPLTGWKRLTRRGESRRMGFLTRCLMRRPLMVSYLRSVHSRDQCLVANVPKVNGGWRRTRTPPPRAVAARLCCSTLPASWIASRPRSRRPSLPVKPACRLRAARAPAPPSTLRALWLWLRLRLRLRLDSPLRARCAALRLHSAPTTPAPWFRSDPAPGSRSRPLAASSWTERVLFNQASRPVPLTSAQRTARCLVCFQRGEEVVRF